jgi:type I restriction enzyme S subunit
MLNEERQDQRVLDWVGGIPERWEVHSLGSQLAANKSSNKGMVESRVLSLSYGRVIVKPLDKLRGLVPESFETYQIVEPGDIVIRPTDLQNDHTSLRVGQSMHRGIITSAYICLRPTDSLNHRYASYLLAAYDFMKVFYGFGSGLRQNLDVKHIKHIPVPVPSLAEQGLIVRYLDHAELRIAKAITAKQDVVRLLREQKAVVESTALFGRGWKTGVDKWFGEVPVEWEVLPSRALFAERIERDRGDLEMLSVTIARGVIKQSSYLKSDGSKKDQAREDRSQYKVVEQNDLVYNKMRAWQGAAGKSDFQGIVSPAYVVLRPFSGANSDYYGMVLRSRQFAREAERYSYGITSDMWSLRPQHFKIIEFPCPPLSEQATIVDRCRTQTKKIDLAMEAIETEILLLKEYRTRLISDVVTGKLDVREEASKLPEIDPMVLATVAVGENGDDEEASDDD